MCSLPAPVAGNALQNPEGEAPAPQPDATLQPVRLRTGTAESRAGRQTRFIAALSYQDAADWGAGLSSNLPPLQGNLAAMSAAVSPNGNYLAFMSQQNLTGYDPSDARGGAAR